MRIGIEGTAPGVEWGKELSLSVEERSSPESHKAWADADGPQPVTYITNLYCCYTAVNHYLHLCKSPIYIPNWDEV